MTKPNSTEIIFVVDRSGSMASIAHDMRGGFSTFIKEQQKTPGECKVTLTQFDDHYDIVYEGKKLADVPPLDLIPRGSTALLDAIGRTVIATGSRISVMQEEDRPSQVLFVIITDGHENASKEFQREKILEMITHQREVYSWEFVFLGADQNAIAVAVDLGISANNAVNFSSDAKGAQGLMRGLSNQVSSYRGSGRGRMDALYNQDAYDSAMQSVEPKVEPPDDKKGSTP